MLVLNPPTAQEQAVPLRELLPAVAELVWSGPVPSNLYILG